MLYAFVSNIVAAVILVAMDIFLNVVVGIILDCFFCWIEYSCFSYSQAVCMVMLGLLMLLLMMMICN